MTTKAEVFQELILRVLHQQCTLEPIEGEKDSDVSRESTAKPGTASIPADADHRQMVT